MKKILVLCCVCLLMLSVLPVGVRADVIFEPWDDTFYEEHREECEYHSRSYTANGPNGDVTVYENPESARKEATIKNGNTLWIAYLYEDADGIRWGYCDDWERDVGGWVPMDYLKLIYDGISFEEDFGHLFVEEEGMLGGEYAGATVYFLKYPGSGDYIDITLGENGEDYRPEYSVVYEDAQGTRWGRCGYYKGIKGYWLNLSDPTGVPAAQSVPVTDESEEPTVPAVPVDEIKPAENPAVKLMVVGAVAATVVVTALLLFLMKKKKG